jgi:hypothetical protein
MADGLLSLLPEKKAEAGLLSWGNPEGLVSAGNIDLNKRPKIKNKDGTFSTIESMSANVGGVEILFPTITPDGKRMTPDQALQRYMQTGEHLGVFVAPEFADRYAKSLSNRQGAFYGVKK